MGFLILKIIHYLSGNKNPIKKSNHIVRSAVAERTQRQRHAHPKILGARLGQLLESADIKSASANVCTFGSTNPRNSCGPGSAGGSICDPNISAQCTKTIECLPDVYYYLGRTFGFVRFYLAINSIPAGEILGTLEINVNNNNYVSLKLRKLMLKMSQGKQMPVPMPFMTAFLFL